MKLILTNAVTLNGGDAAISVAIQKAFAKLSPEPVQWIVCDSQPDVAKRYYQGISFRSLAYSLLMQSGARGLSRLLHTLRGKILERLLPLVTDRRRATGLSARLWPRVFREQLEEYAGAAAMISTGGTYLTENYDLSPRFLEFKLARQLGLPLVLYTQSLGPFVSLKIRRRMKQVFEYATLVLLRDEKSLRHALELGADPGKCRVCADAVFGLYDPQPNPRVLPNHGPAIAVSVRNWKYFRSRDHAEGMTRCLRAVAAVITHMVERYEARVTLVSTCQGVREYRADDSHIAQELCDKFLPEAIRQRVTVDSGFHTPEELLDYLPRFDMAVSVRMHFAILAMAAGVPVLPISYEFKTRELFKTLGLEQWVEDIETVSPDSLAAKADKFWADIAEIRSHLLAELPKQKESALQAARATLEALHQTQRAKTEAVA